MAILHHVYPTPVIHGSRGGTTFSRARPTPTARQLTKQHHRMTARRHARITHPARVHALWRDTLTGQQRTDWNDLGAATNWTDPEDNPYNPTGYCLFVRANLLLEQSDRADQLNAPGSADGVRYAITYAEADHDLHAQMFPVPADRHSVIFLISPPTRFTRYAWSGPYILLVHAASPALHAGWVLIATAAQGFDDTRRHFIRDRAIYPDGSASAPTVTEWNL